MYKICLFGPESVGKTTIASNLAECYETIFVPEVARDMLVNNDFDLAKIIEIGEEQYKAIHLAEQNTTNLLICDTDLITTQIYSKYYLNQVPQILYELENKINFDLYFLLEIDVPWVADGLRDLGHKRQELFDIFKYELDKRNIEYVTISGNWEVRLQKIKNILNKKLLNIS